MTRHHTQAYAFLIRDVVQRTLLCAIALAAVRFLAFHWTGALATLADALNSVVTLIASAVMLHSIWARQPRAQSEEVNPTGGSRLEYMAFGLEGWAILSIGVYVAWHSLMRLFGRDEATVDLNEMSLGIWMLVGVAFATAALAAWVWNRGRSFDSALLVATAKHLVADVASTLGVVLGLVLLRWTQFEALDPIIALVVAGTVLWASWKLLWKSVSGLTDELEREIDPTLRALLDQEVKSSAIISYDHLRIRFNGPKRWIEVRLLVDPSLTIAAGRELGEMVEGRLRSALGDATVVARVEPMEGPVKESDAKPQAAEEEDAEE